MHNVLNVLSTTEVYFKWLKGNIYVVCLLPQLSKKDNIRTTGNSQPFPGETMQTHLPFVKLPRDDKRWPCIESRSRKGKSGSRAGTDLMARPDSAQSFQVPSVSRGEAGV